MNSKWTNYKYPVSAALIAALIPQAAALLGCADWVFEKCYTNSGMENTPVFPPSFSPQFFPPVFIHKNLDL